MFKTITTAICLCAAVAVSAQTPAKPAPAKLKSAAHSTARPAQATTKETRAQLRKEAKVSMAQARSTALKEVPNGRVQTSTLERENGTLVYSFDIKLPGKPGIEEVNVDANTGAVTSHEHETSKMEAKEKKEAKH